MHYRLTPEGNLIPAEFPNFHATDSMEKMLDPELDEVPPSPVPVKFTIEGGEVGFCFESREPCE